MTTKSLSRRLDRLDGTSRGRLWIIDMDQFSSLSRDDAITAHGGGKRPGSEDVVVFIDQPNSDDPLWVMKYADLALFGDPAGRPLGQIIVETVQNSPEARLDSLVRP